MTRLCILAISACCGLKAQFPTLQQFMGSTGLLSGTYVSCAGCSLAGTGTCALTSFGGSATGAQATVPISGGVIASGAPLTFSNFGSGYPVPATTATISNGSGTGVCSGPAGAVTVTTATAEASNRAQIYAGL